MDSSRPVKPGQQVFDVVNAGAGASPNSRSAIVTNRPVQTDPMMAPRNTMVHLPVQPQSHPTAPESLPSIPPDYNPAPQQAYVGHVGKHKKSKLLSITILLVIVAFAAAGYFILFKSV